MALQGGPGLGGRAGPGLRERSFDRSLVMPKEVPGLRALDSAPGRPGSGSAWA